MVTLYIATSIDGYIARTDGNLDWLNSVPKPESGDYGYSELLSSTGTIIMGRKTYSQILGFGIEWPYQGIKTYVVTKSRSFKITTPDTYILSSGIKGFVGQLKQSPEKGTWLMGGGQVVSYFMKNELVDKIILTIVPKILGEGVSLFPGKTKETDWALSGVDRFNTGLVNLTYDFKPAPK